MTLDRLLRRPVSFLSSWVLRFLGLLLLGLACAGTAQAQLLVSRLVDSPDPVVARATVAYTIGIADEKSVARSGITLNVTIPAGVIYDKIEGLPVGASCSGITPGTFTGASATTLSCSNISIPAGHGSDYTLYLRPQVSGALTVAAAIEGVARKQEQNTTVNVGADLGVTIKPMEAAAYGTSQTVEFEIQNYGPNDSPASTLTYSVPSGFDIKPTAVPSGCSLEELSDKTKRMTCSLGAIAVGADRKVTLRVTGTIMVGDGSAMTHTVDIAAGGGVSDGVDGNNSAYQVMDIKPGSLLSVVKSQSSANPIRLNQAFSYQFDLKYSGSFPVGAEVSDTLPANFCFDSSVQPTTYTVNGWSCTVTGNVCPAAGAVLSCTRTGAGSATPGDNVSLGRVTMPVRAIARTEGAGVTNTVNFTATGPGKVTPSSASVLTVVTGTGADLYARKTQNRSPQVAVPVCTSPPCTKEYEIEYSISAYNLGPDDVLAGETVRMVDNVPEGIYVKSISSNGQGGSGQPWRCQAQVSKENATPLTLPRAGPFALVCTSQGKALPSGSLSDVIALYTYATKARDNNAQVENELCVSLPNHPAKDPNTLNDCAYAAVIPQGADTQADVALLKRVRGPGDKSDHRQLAGLPVVWEIEVVNLGPNVARDVALTDSISNVAVDRPYSTALVVAPDSGVVMNNCALNKGTNYLTLTNCVVTTLPVCKASTDTSGSTAPPCPRVQISVVHTGDDATANDFTRTNSASVQTTGTADKVLGNNSSGTVTAYLTGRADLQVLKAGNPAAIAAGQLLNYTITAKNLATSPGTARNVVVTDTLPVGVVFLSATPSGTGSCTAPAKGTAATSGNNTVRCSWASMARNTQQTVTIQVRPQVGLSALVGGPGAITNVVEIASDTLEVNVADNRATLTTQILNPVYDLLVNKNDDADPVDSGDEVTYTLKVTNNGASTAEKVVLTDFLPGDVGAPTYVGIIEKPADVSCTTTGVSVGVAGGTVTCTIPSLPGSGPGATSEGDNFKILKIKLRGAAKGTFPNKAKVAFEESRLNVADQPQTNNEITEFTTVRLKADVEVVSKVAVQSGTSNALPVISTTMATQGFDWLVQLRNNGPSDAETTTFSDTLPDGMVLTGAPTFTVTNGSFTPAAPSCTGAAGGKAVSCALAVMPANATATVRIPVKMSSAPAVGTTITNRASLVTSGSNDTQGGVDPNKPNNYRDGTTTVQNAVVSGYVFYDLNGNGQKEDGEPGIATTLALKNTASNTQVGTTSSDPVTGAWSFAVAPGTYTVTETQPALYANGLTTAGTVGGVTSGTVAGGSRGNEIQGIVVPAGGASINNLFGEERPNITVRVFEDLDNNGVPAATGEAGIGGVTLTLSGVDANGQTVNLTAAPVAGKAGYYIFTDVPASGAAGYTITETQPPLYLPGKASVKSGLPGSAQSGGNSITGVKVSAGTLQLGDYYFGEIRRPNATVTVRVYEDLDDNGAPAATGEAGIGGVTLRLSGTDAQGKAVDLIATAVAGQTGRYSFANVPPSNGAGYMITQSQPTGYLPGKASVNGFPGTVQTGGNVITGVTVNTGDAAVTTLGDYWFGEIRATDLQVVSKVAVATGTATSKTSVLPQEPFDYLVTVRNNGPQATTAVQFSDTLPSGMVLTGAPEFTVTAGTITLQTPAKPCTGAANGTSVGCAIASMSSGAAATVRIPVQLTGNPDVGTVFTNTASIVTTGITDSNGGTDPLGGNNFNRGSVTVAPRADVQILSKTAVATGTAVAKTQLQADERFDFLVLVRNNGPQAAQTTQFSDTLPTGLELAGAPVFTVTGGTFTPAAPTCTTTGGMTVTCAIADMPANGTATVRIPVRIKNPSTLVSGQVLTNTASIVTTGTIDTNGGTDPLGGNNHGSGSITYSANLSADVQVLDKTAVATGKDAATGKLTGVEPNQSFDWLVRVKNAGPDAAQTVTVTDTLPAGMVLTGAPVFTVTSGTFTPPSPVCTGTKGGNAVSCPVTNMPANGEATLRIPVQITDASLVGKTVSNSATIAATGSSDTKTNNNSGTGTIPVQGSIVSGFVYHDANANGQKDAGEAGIAGVTLTLNGTRQGGGAVAQQTATTDASGAWSFPVPAGTYTVAETQPALYANGLTAVGTVSGTASGTVVGGTRGNTIQGIVVPANGSSINNLFGEELSTITVRVFEDLDNNGVPAATGEAGIGGVALKLTGTDANGQAVNLTATAVAGKAGYYVFTDVPVSNATGYTITETQPEAYLPGKASVQTGQPGSAQTDGNRITSVAVTASTLQLGDYLFGELRRAGASVTARVFEDQDDDGAL
ncbi:S-layer family protein, partial [uncultured Azohydromonas sp.]|uniref:beta strand repeat-containing protein n=1 Tax=uncultured Azohydromonas sp. TaxID=487342 RepID=UPI002616C18D